MRHRLSAKPLLTVLVLAVFFAVLAILGALVLGALFPRLPGYSVRGPSQSLVLVLLDVAVLLGLIAGFRWWRLAGFTPRHTGDSCACTGCPRCCYSSPSRAAYACCRRPPSCC